MRQFLSKLSIVISISSILLKVNLDIVLYQRMKELAQYDNTDISPNFISYDIPNFILIPLAINFILVVMGYVQKNEIRKIAMWFYVVSFIYLILPFGMLLGIL